MFKMCMKMYYVKGIFISVQKYDTKAAFETALHVIKYDVFSHSFL